MKTFLSLLIFIVIITPALTAGKSVGNTREDRLINNDWKFFKGDMGNSHIVQLDDSKWENLSIPHTWNNLDGQDGGGDYYRGTGWYRKHVFINAKHSEKNIYIQFDGVNRKTDVYVNGKFAGSHTGGFARFRFNLTPFIKFGVENLIAVRVNNEINNSIPVDGDFTFCGGIYRSVHLLITEKLHVDVMDYSSSGIYVNSGTAPDGTANIAITVRASNDNSIQKKITLRTLIKDKIGNTIKHMENTEIISPGRTISIKQITSITSPVLWNGIKDPALYAAKVEILEGKKLKDAVEQKFGIRNIKIDSEKGLFLNGKNLRLKGVNRHQDKKDKGWAISSSDQAEDMKLISEIGANAIRCAHYQQDQLWYNLCDENGMIVWTEVPFFGRALENEEFYSNAKLQLWEMIKQNYNHPSIAFWGIGNETLEDSTVKLLEELNIEAHRADSIRPTTYASNKKDEDPLNEITDVLAFNKYYGWYRESTDELSKWLMQFHQKYPSRITGISEYGAGASVFQHETYPVQRSADQPWHPEEIQTVFHEKTWNILKDKDYLWGTFIWCMFDFASDRRDEGDKAGINDKGLVTQDRKIKKDAFYWYKANWTDDPFVYITDRRFTDRTDSLTEVKLYTTLTDAELFLNGKSAGKKTAAWKIIKWDNLPLRNGKNVLKAVSYKNGKAYSDEIFWNFRAAESNTRVIASSYSRDSAPENAIDGDKKTLWQSAGNKKRQFPQWIMIDLGKVRPVNRIEISWKEGEGCYFNYSIEAGDEKDKLSLTSQKDLSSISIDTKDELNITARFIRILINSSSDINVWPGISEIKIL